MVDICQLTETTVSALLFSFLYNPLGVTMPCGSCPEAGVLLLPRLAAGDEAAVPGVPSHN